MDMQLLQSNSSRVYPGPELEDDDSNSIESLCNIPCRFVYFCYEKNSEFWALSKRASLDSVIECCDWCTATALAVSIVVITVTVIFFIFAVVITVVLIIDDMGSVNSTWLLSLLGIIDLDALQYSIFPSPRSQVKIGDVLSILRAK